MKKYFLRLLLLQLLCSSSEVRDNSARSLSRSLCNIVEPWGDVTQASLLKFSSSRTIIIGGSTKQARAAVHHHGIILPQGVLIISPNWNWSLCSRCQREYIPPMSLVTWICHKKQQFLLAPEANAWPNNTVGNNRVTLSHSYLFFYIPNAQSVIKYALLGEKITLKHVAYSKNIFTDINNNETGILQKLR